LGLNKERVEKCAFLTYKSPYLRHGEI